MNDTSPNVHTDEIVQRQLRLLERVVHACLAEASRFIVNPDSLAQEVAVALHGTIVELAHACGALVLSDDFSSIPIVMRSLLEASIDQANLLVDADYVMNMEAADHAKFLDLLEQSVPGTNPYLAGLAEQHDISAEIRERQQRIADLLADDRRSLKVFERFKLAQAEDQYRSVYAILCLDSHNNFSALAERHRCENYALLLDTKGNTFINSPPTGTIYFKVGNVDRMTVDSLHTTMAGELRVNNAVMARGVGGSLANLANFTGVGARGADGFSNNGSDGVIALGGNFGSGAMGGFGIEAEGGKNSDGTLQRAGEFHGDVEIQGCLGVAGTPNIGTCSSDLRLKKNIEAFPAVLDKVAQLRPVSYEWQREKYPQRGFSSGRNSGLIAQEVEKVFPELVSADAAGFKRVNYGELPFLMLQAIRELKAQNDALRRELREVDATKTREIAGLRSQLRRPQLDALLP